MLAWCEAFIMGYAPVEIAKHAKYKPPAIDMIVNKLLVLCNI